MGPARALLLLLLASTASRVDAACDVIPGPSTFFEGTLGTTDRPFARPGDVVELHLDSPCHAATSSFLEKAADHAVTIVFKPPAGPRHLVVVRADSGARYAEVRQLLAEARAAGARRLALATRQKAQETR